jgi:diguanylate cyclase
MAGSPKTVASCPTASGALPAGGPDAARRPAGGRPGSGTRASGWRFAQRMRLPRALGLALGSFAVAAVLHQDQASLAAWLALVANAFVWPHVAYALAVRSHDPVRVERRNLIADSAAGGVWIVVMGFNLLPSVLLVSMLAMDKLAAGGNRLLARGLIAQALACAAAAVVLGAEFRPTTTMLNVVACLPLLVVYPMIVGVTGYRLSRRVREQNRLLAELSRIDGLSRLLNRSHWEAAVVAEFKRSLRGGAPAALLMIDIDHFKPINDRHGHLVGDAVIRDVAALVRETLRESDTAGRYGGEEFGVVLPDTGMEGATAIAERIRQRIAGANVGTRAEIRCTVSIGVAETTADLTDPHEWIERADRALYRAKSLGRNRTVRHGAVAATELTLVGGAR